MSQHLILTDHINQPPHLHFHRVFLFAFEGMLHPFGSMITGATGKSTHSTAGREGWRMGKAKQVVVMRW